MQLKSFWQGYAIRTISLLVSVSCSTCVRPCTPASEPELGNVLLERHVAVYYVYEI